MKLAIIIPTVDGRQEHLARCVRGYATRTPGHTLRLFVIPNRETCGIAWQEGADLALKWGADLLHLTADDIVPSVGWSRDCLTRAMEGFVPAALICQPDRDILAAETDLPDEDNPLCGKVNHWEGHNCPDGELAEGKPGKYASVPLCTRGQWEKIAPMIVTHYGTDKWFSRRAELAGFPIIATESMLLYHFAAPGGRAPRYDGWLHSDLLAYDMNIAYPRYIAGELVPTELPETRGTAAGREEARDFLRRSGL